MSVVDSDHSSVASNFIYSNTLKTDVGEGVGGVISFKGVSEVSLTLKK